MTPIRAVAFALLFLSWHAFALEPGELPWHSVPATAIAVARGQQKMLLIYYRGACGGCNDKMDAVMRKAAEDEVFLHALDAYVPLRVTAGSDASVHPMIEEIARRGEEPLLVLYDASGIPLIALERKANWSSVVEELLHFRAERRRITRSVELRLAGRIADADLIVGNVLLNAQAGRAAAEILERAADGFDAANAKEFAQMAQVLAGSARYSAGQENRGRNMIADVLRKPVSDAVAAEAYMALASQNEAISLRASAPRDSMEGPSLGGFNDRRAKDRAVEAYRKAYEVAPAGSMALQRARQALSRLDDQPLPRRKSEAPAPLRIVLPARTPILGDTDFQIDGAAGAMRVDYLLDGVKVASSSKQPFQVSINVGRVPSVRTLKAVAFAADGSANGEATATINDRLDAFLVSIVAPATPFISGPNDVVLDVRVPPGRSLARVRVEWNGKEIAALDKAPYRTRVDVAAGEFGYLRAEAFLDDGTATESTRLYNSSGVSESVDVGAVTVIATVNDEKGERIGGLTSSDFSIRDEGQAVVPTLRSSDDDPVTIGIAIDSSSSMSGRQLYVIRAATDFLARALRPQDQAFVVAFDTGARLVHPRSSDTARLRESVYDLTPRGGTSIFDGVTFALQQFQGISGKKALLVFSDGREGTSSASARECERLARTIGVPVYVFVPPGAGDRSSNALKGIAGFTGGTMFHAEPVAMFPVLFDRLAAEMRGQYVLSFARPAGVKTGTWRSLRVSVERHKATVRSMQGYRAN